jgi:GT2 family glycosyltransferase
LTPEPTVTIVVPTYNGAGKLRACLDSVATLEYPRDRLETIVVDNGSTDGSRELLEQDYPRVHVLALPENVGFAAAVNVGARAAGSDLVATCNNDMRLDPAWLRELVRRYSPESGVACVAGTILDWSGERVQFANGIVNFHGAAAQVPFDVPLAEVTVEDGRELPFACGGSMLIERKTFIDLGGFDEAFWSYFEDVDFGWRYRLTGGRIRLAGASLAYHRHHSTGATIPPAERRRIYERNWLFTLVKNVSDENLHRLLAAGLELADERARLTRLQPAPQISAVREFCAGLPLALEKRRHVQRLRRIPDSEVLACFGRPFFPVLDDLAYLEAQARVIEAYRLDELFPGALRDDLDLLAEQRRRATMRWRVARAAYTRLPPRARALLQPRLGGRRPTTPSGP